MRTVIIIVFPVQECWGNFKKLCKAKGWKHQEFANKGHVPKLDQPGIEINGNIVHRVRML